MGNVTYKIIMEDQNGRKQEINGLYALCEVMWDVCFAIGVDYGDSKDEKTKEVVKIANYVCRWISRLMDWLKENQKEEKK